MQIKQIFIKMLRALWDFINFKGINITEMEKKEEKKRTELKQFLSFIPNRRIGQSDICLS